MSLDDYEPAERRRFNYSGAEVVIFLREDGESAFGYWSVRLGGGKEHESGLRLECSEEELTRDAKAFIERLKTLPGSPKPNSSS